MPETTQTEAPPQPEERNGFVSREAVHGIVEDIDSQAAECEEALKEFKSDLRWMKKYVVCDKIEELVSQFEKYVKLTKSIGSDLRKECDQAVDDDALQYALDCQEDLTALADHVKDYIDSHERNLACKSWDFERMKEALAKAS